MIVKERMNVPMNSAPSKIPMHIPHVNKTNNICAPQGIEPSIIPYTTNQPADSQL